jgi:transposase
LKRTWALRGQTPELRHPGTRRKITALAGLSLEPTGRVTESFTLFDHNPTANDFFWNLIGYWKRFRDRYDKLIVVWDGLPRHWQTASLMRRIELPWIEFHRLPGYAPDLNPVEHVWSQTKYHAMANWSAANVDELRTRAAAELRRLRQRQPLLRSFFLDAGLTLDRNFCNGQ